MVGKLGEWLGGLLGGTISLAIMTFMILSLPLSMIALSGGLILVFGALCFLVCSST